MVIAVVVVVAVVMAMVVVVAVVVVVVAVVLVQSYSLTNLGRHLDHEGVGLALPHQP